MKKLTAIILTTAMIASLSACGTKAETKTLTGTGQGYGGDVTVTVTMEGDKITKVEAKGDKETQGIGSNAVAQLPAKFVEKNSADVDVVAGATVSSRGLIYAVKNALDPTANPWPIVDNTKPGEVTASTIFHGLGFSNVARTGPGKDDTDTQVWSFNNVYADVLFDKDGKILYIYVDQLEVASPNYDGAGMPHISGWPGQTGYNVDENHDEKVDGKTAATDDTFKAEVALWKTKRQRGDEYKVGISTWQDQMDSFQKMFVGMTIAEIEEWNKKFTSDRNGRPLKDGSTDAADKAKYDALTADEKADLAEITATATISLTDAHGNIIEAIKNAYANKQQLKITEAASSGFGVSFMPRIGPGKDDTDTQVYSFNEVVVNTLFDKDGKIAYIHIDQLEVASPNYDGAGMPHFSGWPGQGGYNFDENHDEKVDGKTPDTEANFQEEIKLWKSKRERGADYKVGISTWHEQMDAYEEIFTGMTVAEIETWFKKYTSDRNGRPLKDGSEDAADKAKYDALTADEKADLAEVTASATMSLNDAHGNIIEAIKASFANKEALALTVK